MKKISFLSLAISILFFFTGSVLKAATRTSSQSGNWSASSTWGGNPAPTGIDDVIINGNFTVTVDVSNAVSQSVQLGGSVLNAGTGALVFASGTQLTISGVLNIGPFNNNGTAGSLNMAAGGNLACEGIIVGRLGTWTSGAGTVEFTATNTLPNDNNVNFNNLTLSGGTTTLSRNLDVLGNLLINPGGTLATGINTLSLTGDWTNNGTFTGTGGTVIFVKNGNQVITGTGANNFNLLRVNMGTSISNTLEVLSANFSAPDAFLTLTNGTFKVSGTFTFASTFFTGPSYNIQPGTGLWINNPNVTIVAQAGGLSVRGLLRISAGTYNVGTAVNNSLAYVSGSVITIEGGSLNIAGQLTRNNSTATTTYTQSGGTVTVAGIGSTDPTFGAFDLGAVGSTFTTSGGTIIIRNATSGPADYINASSVANVTGGTLQVGDANTANAQTIRIQTSRPVGALLVSNATSQATKPTAQLTTSSLNVAGSVTIQTGATLNTNGLNISLGGDWTDNGTFLNGNTVTFNGTAAQAITRPAGETFVNLTVSKSGGTLTLNNSVTVNTTFAFTLGNLAVGTNLLTLNSTVTGGGTFTSSSTGTVSYNQGSAGQNVLAGNYGNLIFSDFNKVLASIGTIGISGTFTPGAATGHTVIGSTIDFNGASQAVPAFAYNNLTASGSGTKTASGTLTVSGSFTNSAGITFTGASTLNLNGTVHTNSGTLSAATLSIGPGANLTNNGTTTASGVLSGTGTLTQGATGILNIGGSASLTSLDASASGNTVNYTGNSQSVRPSAYYNLSLSGSGTPLLTGVSTINGNFTLSGTVTPVAASGMNFLGNLTIGAGTSFDAGTFSHTLKGNLSSAGTFIEGTSTFTMNGTGSQSLGVSGFYNLAIANAAGIALTSDFTIDGTLTLTSGTFSIGAHTLNLNGAISTGAGSLAGGSTSNLVVGGSGANTALPGITLNNLTLNRSNGLSLSGDVNINGTLTILAGTLNTGANSIILGSSAIISEPAGLPIVGMVTTTRNVTTTSGTESFGNIGAEITLNGVATGNTTVLRKTGIVSNGSGHSSIKRYFDITPANNTGLNAGLVFHYDLSELNGQTAALLELYRSPDNGTTWNNMGGTVNTSSRTISMTGINDFSRWTASDTNNRIGNSPTPSLTSISPSSKNLGDPAFTMTVIGNNFVNGKSIVKFNGSDRATAFISATQLTASIPASDLLVSGSFPVTVFNSSGGGSSNPQTFTVNPLPPAVVRVETAADGSGTVVPAQSLASGSSITVYAVSRDALNNFVANVAATAWTLENITGGVVSGDLIPSGDNKSAVFTGHVIGAADIKATSGSLAPTPSGMITVIPGAATKVRVENAANGTGVVVPAQSVTSGSSITVYSITRDASDNFLENVVADNWDLQNISGGVVPGDLVQSADGRSAVFTGHATGSANIRATSGNLVTISSGTITVTSGNGGATMIRVETAADGSGIVVPAQSLSSGIPLTVYAITRDASLNFIANVAASAWTLENMTGGVVPGDLVPSADSKSAVFMGHVTGSAGIRATSGTLSPVPSGLITVIPGIASKVRVETAADGTGTVVPEQTLESGSSITVYSITRDASNNFVENVAADSWSLQNISGGVVQGDLVSSQNGKSAVLTGHAAGSANIVATSGSRAVTGSGTITITVITGIDEANNPSSFDLKQNYPNPFSGNTTIGFALPSDSHVTLSVYDMQGREVANLLDENEGPGYKLVTFESSNLQTGTYYYRLVAGNYAETRKMIIVR